jgi:uncharacterized membrane protein YesL
MLYALRLAFAAWWRELIDYAVLNVLWVGCSLSIVLGPPAFAAMYQMASDSADRHVADWQSYFAAIKKLFFPAWRWGLLQLAVYGIGGFNFLYYSYASGTCWALLRGVWFVCLTVWTVLNVFYWPFYMEQTDRRIKNTYRNVLVLCATRPGMVVGVALVTVAVTALSAGTVILCAFGVMPLVALIGTFAARQALDSFRSPGEIELESMK